MKAAHTFIKAEMKFVYNFQNVILERGAILERLHLNISLSNREQAGYPVVVCFIYRLHPARLVLLGHVVFQPYILGWGLGLGAQPIISLSLPEHLDFHETSRNCLILLGEPSTERAKRFHVDSVASRKFHCFWGSLGTTRGHTLSLASLWSLIRGTSGQ